MSNPDLLPCPFCDSTSVIIVAPTRRPEARGRWWYVFCECQTEGPPSQVSAEDAARKWNRRAAPPVMARPDWREQAAGKRKDAQEWIKLGAVQEDLDLIDVLKEPVPEIGCKREMIELLEDRVKASGATVHSCNPVRDLDLYGPDGPPAGVCDLDAEAAYERAWAATGFTACDACGSTEGVGATYTHKPGCARAARERDLDAEAAYRRALDVTATARAKERQGERGTIQDVRIYGRALEPAELIALASVAPDSWAAAEARELCGCAWCLNRDEFPTKVCDRRLSVERGIRAGLAKAAEVATKVGPMNQSDSLDAAARIRALLENGDAHG